MSKLKTKQLYFSKCEYGNHIIEYLVRDRNVNSLLTDDDIYRLADNEIGTHEASWCDVCNKKTMQTVVAYELAETKPSKQVSGEAKYGRQP